MAHVFSAPLARKVSSIGDLLRSVQQPALEQAAHTHLRRLKNRLQARFPLVKSSHLSEAIAVSLGYSTNAAMRADLPGDPELATRPMDFGRLRQRLVDFQYPLQQDFSSAPVPSMQPPPDYLARLAELRRLQQNPDYTYGRIRRLRRECAAQFAQAFGLGHPEVVGDKSVVQRWEVGVDHGACLPGWGGLTSRHMLGEIKFPGSDHVERFFQDLPVSRQGKHCEYQSAFVSMPYLAREGLAEHLQQAALVAGRLGWTMTVLSAWSWYQAGETELVLFRRTTPHEQVLKEWGDSFSRWALENRSRLRKAASDERREVLEDIISCRHLPWDVRDFEDCIERYLCEFAPHMYEDASDAHGLEFRLLMQRWQDSRNA